ncbi:unnamed protein product [Rodentolepis nana]|uniref:Uncharacterized protein n=1 Tax=Rodentolepis nana TaxID=102285 RepID=A0A0R3TTM4_RODNA|nr:unnamed protein product [Rodentolepis nana]
MLQVVIHQIYQMDQTESALEHRLESVLCAHSLLYMIIHQHLQ